MQRTPGEVATNDALEQSRCDTECVQFEAQNKEKVECDLKTLGTSSRRRTHPVTPPFSQCSLVYPKELSLPKGLSIISAHPRKCRPAARMRCHLLACTRPRAHASIRVAAAT